MLLKSDWTSSGVVAIEMLTPMMDANIPDSAMLLYGSKWCRLQQLGMVLLYQVSNSVTNGIVQIVIGV
jgi:hypothetical protein